MKQHQVMKNAQLGAKSGKHAGLNQKFFQLVQVVKKTT